MDVAPLAIANGWASGISAYATVLLLGLLGRIGWADTPVFLQRTDILVIAAILTAVELVADKIPYLDSVWDSVHTVIRPAIAAAVGALIASDASTGAEAATAVGTASVALLSHTAKSGIRLAVNTSPEPVTNVGVSAAEDLSVLGVVLLAWQYPWAAAGIAIVLLVIGLGLAAFLFSRIRRGWRALAARLDR
jgi:hypothetical protein